MAESNILLESGTNELEVLEFMLNRIDENGDKEVMSFGINVSKIRKISQIPEITETPGMHPCIKGVFYLRDIHDSYITIIDLGRYLYNIERDEYPKNTIAIIAEFNQILCAFIVDGINRIHRVSWTEVVAPKFNKLSQDNGLVVGVVKKEKRNILMLDVEKIVINLGLVGMDETREHDGFMLENPIIVTAEDSPLIRNMLTERLTAFGYRIKPFENGQEAWDYLEESAKKAEAGENLEELVNGIITDVEMPMMDGYTLTKNVKNHPILFDLPVVIFSSMINEDILHKGNAVGANAQLSKPQIGELSDVMYKLTIEKDFSDDDDEEEDMFDMSHHD